MHYERKTMLTPVALAAALASMTIHAADARSAANAAPGPEIAVKRDNSRGLHFFEPAGLHVQVGDAVRWASSAYQHTITAYHPDNGRELRMPEGAQPFDEHLGEASRDYRDSFSYTFTRPGTYDFFCRYHEAQGEVGRIIVGEPGGPASRPPGYADAPTQPSGFSGLSSALLLPKVQQVFGYLEPQQIVERKQLSFPAERVQPGVAWHPLNPQPITIKRAPDANADPLAGMWVLDAERSSFPGAPPEKETFTYEFSPGGDVRFSVEEIRDGAAVSAAYSGRFDGKDYPIRGAPGRDTLAMIRPTADVIMGVYKYRGRITYSFTRTLSDDGRTMTSRVLGVADDGRPIDVSLVHQKHHTH